MGIRSIKGKSAKTTSVCYAYARRPVTVSIGRREQWVRSLSQKKTEMATTTLLGIFFGSIAKLGTKRDKMEGLLSFCKQDNGKRVPYKQPNRMKPYSLSYS